MSARIIDAPRPDLDPSVFTDQLDGDAMHAFTSINEHEHATNAGSLRLWGSSAYPRMDRADAARMADAIGSAVSGMPRVVVTGFARRGVAAVHSTLTGRHVADFVRL